jgi:hypothetical protein
MSKPQWNLSALSGATIPEASPQSETGGVILLRPRLSGSGRSSAVSCVSTSSSFAQVPVLGSSESSVVVPSQRRAVIRVGFRGSIRTECLLAAHLKEFGAATDFAPKLPGSFLDAR